MQKISVDCSDASYDLFVGAGVRSEIASQIALDNFSSIFVITESVIEEKWIGTFPEQVEAAKRYLVQSGEGSKSITSAESVWQFLLENGADRKSLLFSIGGGMVTDLGGFIASTFMRGMSFVHVPTTLLSQVDASIGGKTGVNFGGVKNIIGTFTQPKAVFIDTELLSTLPENEFKSGMAEVIKHGLIRDGDYLKECLSIEGVSKIDEEKLEQVIARSCEIKRDVVSEDEREAGVRKLLNFGHTFGHAFESLSHKYGKPLLHGEAVAIGMAAEAGLSSLCGLLEPSDVETVIQALKAVGLPTKLQISPPFDEVFSLLTQDKKNTAGVISWTLLRSIGEGVVDQCAEKTLVERSYQAIL